MVVVSYCTCVPLIVVVILSVCVCVSVCVCLCVCVSVCVFMMQNCTEPVTNFFYHDFRAIAGVAITFGILQVSEQPATIAHFGWP